MDSDSNIIKPPQPASPTELLSAQASALAKLVEIQKSQREQIEELRLQNERIIGLLGQDKKEAGIGHVKIEDINMPFLAMIGLLVKVSLASIPALLILALIYGILTIIFGGLLGGLLGRLF